MDKNCNQLLHLSTSVDVKEYSFDWELHNYGPLYRKFTKNFHMFSPPIKFDDDAELEWSMKLDTSGRERDVISVWLKKGSTQSRIIHVTLSLLTSDGDLVNFKENKLTTETIGFKHIASVPVKTKLFADKENSCSCSSNTLIARFNATYYSYTANPICSIYNKNKMIPKFNGFENLLGNEKFSDAKIIVGSHTFNVHKCILDVRSEFFSAMFNSEMKEKSENKVKISDVSPEVMQELLRFIYTGRVNNMSNLKMELLVASDKYMIEDLKNMCEEALIQGLKNENVPTMILFAEKYSARNLKAASLKFFTIHKKEIMTTNGFANISKILPASTLDTMFKQLFVYNFFKFVKVKH